MRPSKICVIGCGHWGKNLVRTFSALGTLHGIYDADLERAESVAASYPSVKVYRDYQSALADPEITAVAIATPAESHRRNAISALMAGKHAFVEKPLALEWEEGEEMVEVARRERRVLMVGHLLHFHPAVVKLKEMIRSGELGRIEYIYSNRLSMGKIRREENALWSFAPHDISVILSLVGAMPVQVVATGGAYLQPNIADVTLSNLLFDRGTRAHIFVSWLHPYKEQRLVVIGSSKMAVFEDTRPDKKLMLFSREIELKAGVLEANKPEGISVPFPASEPLFLECEHFLDCIEQGLEPRTPGEEGVRVLQVLQACQKSIQLNGEPVQVVTGQQKMVAL